MHASHDRKFRPAIEGEYEEPWYRLPQMAAGWIIERVRSSCQARLDSMAEGYHRDRAAQGDETFMKAVRYIVREVERGHGRRFQISTRRLAQVIGMSQSTASRCLRRLRDMGVLNRHREHRVTRYKRRWLGKAAVHEVVTHGEEMNPEGGESRSVTCEKGAFGPLAPPSFARCARSSVVAHPPEPSLREGSSPHGVVQE